MKKSFSNQFRCYLSFLARSFFVGAAAVSLTTAAQGTSIPLALVQQEVSPAEATAYSAFGTSVALRGNTALIGADGNNDLEGAAYFYTKSADTWTEGQRITPSDPQTNSSFGGHVALQGSTAVVSADLATVDGHDDAGAVYLFSFASGSWVQIKKLTAPTPRRVPSSAPPSLSMGTISSSARGLLLLPIAPVRLSSCSRSRSCS